MDGRVVDERMVDGGVMDGGVMGEGVVDTRRRVEEKWVEEGGGRSGG